MAKPKTLLMTGWGLPVYAPAAALAYGSPKIAQEADILGVSQRYLAEEVRNRGGGYGEIYILGIGLETAAEALARAIRDLGGEGPQVVWVSDRPVPEGCRCAFNDRDGQSCLQTVCGDPDTCDLLDMVGEVFGCPRSEVAYFRRFVEEATGGQSIQAYYQKLFRAADWYHKTYRNLEIYSRSIKLLAAKEPRPRVGDRENEMTKIVEFYERWGKRALQGKSPQIEEVRGLIALAARHDDAEARVLITGPSGTGKETVAQQIHIQSSRKDGPFMSFNCACTTRGLFESRLFGHTAGGFTDARKEEKGLFELAEKGTLFLDEVAELDIELQGYLLRVLQEGEFLKVGSSVPQKVRDVRVITATNKDLGALVRAGRFREDLYWRLKVITISMCGLGERPEDIVPIAEDLWYRETRQRLRKDQAQALMNYDYPGNARELENMLVKARVLEIRDFGKLVEGARAESEQLRANPAVGNADQDAERDESLDAAIRRHARRMYDTYTRAGYSQARIAREVLKISENSLRKYLRPVP